MDEAPGAIPASLSWAVKQHQIAGFCVVYKEARRSI